MFCYITWAKTNPDSTCATQQFAHVLCMGLIYEAVIILPNFWVVRGLTEIICQRLYISTRNKIELNTISRLHAFSTWRNRPNVVKVCVFPSQELTKLPRRASAINYKKNRSFCLSLKCQCGRVPRPTLPPTQQITLRNAVVPVRSGVRV